MSTEADAEGPMEIRRIKPQWRHFNQDNPIEIVTRPTREWFDRLTPVGNARLARFAVLQTGDVLFGDAFHVLHQDMARVGVECWLEEDGHTYQNGWFEPLVGGSIMFDRATELWRIALLQFYGYDRKGSIARFKPLSRRLSTWTHVAKTLGNDPMDHILPTALEL